MKLMCYCFGGIGYSVDIKETIKQILKDENREDIIVDNCRLLDLARYLNDYDWFITGKLFEPVFEKRLKSIKDKSKFIYINDLTPDSIKSRDNYLYNQTKKLLKEYKII